jgi:Bacterial type II/III secretion system short domain
MQNQITLMSRTLLGLWIFLTAVMILCNGSWAADVAVIRIKYRWASEVLPIIQSMLSPQGTVTVSERINSLIIVDSQDSIQRVRAYLEQFDIPLAQVKIHVRFYERRTNAAGSVSAGGRVSHDDMSVSVGGRKKDGVDLSLEESRRRQTNYAEFLVIATSGRPAFIRSGQEIPYRGKWPDYTRHYAPNADTTVFQAVETGFEVTPTVVGENVLMRIVPRIAYGERNDTIIRFYGAQTELTAPFGRWVEIGGANTHSNEVIEEILSRGSESRRSSMVMSLMVEKP